MGVMNIIINFRSCSYGIIIYIYRNINLQNYFEYNCVFRYVLILSIVLRLNLGNMILMDL